MRRITFASVALLLAATSVFAFDTTKRRVRIGLLADQNRNAYERDLRASDDVRRQLGVELAALGIDSFTVNEHVADLERGRNDFDYYLEVLGMDDGSHPVGGVGIGSRHAGVDVAVMVSRVAATVNVYDGRTLELLDVLDLAKRNTAVAPTAISLGGGRGSIWGFFAVPVVEWSQYRAGVRAVAREAAKQIAQALRD